MKLYTSFRSSAAYRVRIALGLKGLDYEAVPVHLVRDGGEHRRPEYLVLNPAGLVPTLEDGGQVLTQSLAIVEWLDETHPQQPLLPQDAFQRARVRAFAYAIACEIHPVQNLKVLNRVRALGGEEATQAWAKEINAKSPTAQRMLKYAFNLPDDGLVGQQLFAGEATRLAYMTEEAQEGRDAFVQKRPKNFSRFPWHY